MKSKSTLAWETYRDWCNAKKISRAARLLKKDFILNPWQVEHWYTQYLNIQLDLPLNPIVQKPKKQKLWQPWGIEVKKNIRILNPKMEEVLKQN